MTETTRASLAAAGIDVQDALSRLLGNESLYLRLLTHFLSAPNMERLCVAIAADARHDALTAAHALKGVSGNLSLRPMHALLERQVALFRADAWADACALLPEIAQCHARAVTAIRQVAM